MSTFPVRAPAPFEASDPRRLGDYELLGRLGSGGMGVVFLGRRASDGELVAVKIYHAHLDARYKLSERFRREALAAMRVPRQCTAPVLDVALDEAIPYIVTAYVPGLTLAEQVSTHGPLAADDLDAVAVGLAKALAAVHDVGVIHRDLTPRNVILSPYGPRIIDFGVAVAGRRCARPHPGRGRLGQPVLRRARADPGALGDAGVRRVRLGRGPHLRGHRPARVRDGRRARPSASCGRAPDLYRPAPAAAARRRGRTLQGPRGLGRRPTSSWSS